ncbi:hypothetical protein CONPUDRAFT_74671 [Coniophora puteana RWD-64-598 SS2]|uniref:Zn(2)-C6 fungal-type domain-containing protein n=1 Tax=Coniophora puteana (strain RWD-64-598) TaxID=741705 RepID=A0A5M3MKJ3_CONPW|nr:uncharacterized protein CONPUDRAFT_74671 [Coniophora puteana RWD-64-598 SS2]EIW79175.1 hypothetical protein CONPUDRAFT_74671 [Coniophora puteana RWD-64-598 SS2]
MALIMPPRDDGEEEVQDLVVRYNTGHPLLGDAMFSTRPDPFDPRNVSGHQRDVHRPVFDPTGSYHIYPANAVRDGSLTTDDPEYYQDQVLPSSYLQPNFRRVQCDGVPHLQYPEVENHAFLHSSTPFTYHEGLYQPTPWNQALYDPACGADSASEEYRAALARQSDNFLASAFSLTEFATNSYVPSPPHEAYTSPGVKRKREEMNNDYVLGEDFSPEAAGPPVNYRQFKRSPSSSPGTQFLHDLPRPAKSPRLSEETRSPALHAPKIEQPHHTVLPPAATQHQIHCDRPSSCRPALESGTSSSLVTTIKNATGHQPGNKSTALSIKPTTRVRGDKKQALACLFCRERKIACGRPPADSPDRTCNQCARRRLKCDYPTESRRGQHKRIRRAETGAPTA